MFALKTILVNSFIVAALLPHNNNYIVEGAVAQVHSHSHNSHSHKHSESPSKSKEREQDGAYSPRDGTHYDDPGHGHGHGHRTEFDHEAIIGSAKEAEEFDKLPAEEAKKRLAHLVRKMDINNDGAVDKRELKAWILRSFKMLSEEESDGKLKDIDKNRDGRISWKEYLEETYGIQEDNLQVPMQDLEEAKMLKDDKALFEAADKNKDGFIDAREHVAFTHPEEDPDMLPVIYQQTYKNAICYKMFDSYPLRYI